MTRLHFGKVIQKVFKSSPNGTAHPKIPHLDSSPIHNTVETSISPTNHESPPSTVITNPSRPSSSTAMAITESIPMRRVRQRIPGRQAISLPPFLDKSPSSNQPDVVDDPPSTPSTSSSDYSTKIPIEGHFSSVYEPTVEKFLVCFEKRYPPVYYWNDFSAMLILGFLDPAQVKTPSKSFLCDHNAPKICQAAARITHEIHNCVAICGANINHTVGLRSKSLRYQEENTEETARFRLVFLVERGALPLFIVGFTITISALLDHWSLSYTAKPLITIPRSGWKKDVSRKNGNHGVSFSVIGQESDTLQAKVHLRPLDLRRSSETENLPLMVEVSLKKAVALTVQLDHETVAALVTCWGHLLDSIIIDGDEETEERLLTYFIRSLRKRQQMRCPMEDLISI